MMFYYGPASVVLTIVGAVVRRWRLCIYCDDGRWKHMGMVIILLLLANS